MKSVPLVVYKEGERRIIGKAWVRADGRISGEIETRDPELHDLIKADRSGFSVGPAFDFQAELEFFAARASVATGLDHHVCFQLLKAGWRLNQELGQPTTWQAPMASMLKSVAHG